MDNIKAIAENANETTDGWFDESLKENVEDYSDALQKSRKYLSDLSQYQLMIERVLREIAAGDPEFAQAIAGKTFNEQIEAATSSYERYLAVFMRLRNTAAHDPFGLYYNSLDEIGRVLRNEVMPDLDSFTTYLRNALTAEGYDFSNLSAQQKALAPSIRLSAHTLDLGTVGEKKKLKGFVTITNDGRSDLKFQDLQVTHPALNVSLKKQTLAPGKSVKLHITVNAKFLRGHLEHTPRVLMITNDPKHPKAEIKINVTK